MSTWNEYKEYVRETDPETAKIIAVAESEAGNRPGYSSLRAIVARSFSLPVTEYEHALITNSYS